MELTKQLRLHLSSASSYETQEMLLQRILSSYDKAMLILNLSGSVSRQPQLVGTAAGFPESSVSANASPRSTEFDKGFKDQQEQKDVSKKRWLFFYFFLRMWFSFLLSLDFVWVSVWFANGLLKLGILQKGIASMDRASEGLLWEWDGGTEWWWV